MENSTKKIMCFIVNCVTSGETNTIFVENPSFSWSMDKMEQRILGVEAVKKIAMDFLNSETKRTCLFEWASDPKVWTVDRYIIRGMNAKSNAPTEETFGFEFYECQWLTLCLQ